MAKVIIAWCDRCLETDPDTQVPATTTAPMTLDTTSKARPRTIDLCEQCHKELVQPLVDALDSYGVIAQPGIPGRQPNAIAKPVSGVGPKPAREPSTDDIGLVRPRGGKKAQRPGVAVLGPFKCPVPGCTQRTPSVNLDGFYQHVRNRHGLTVRGYREQYGDPGPGQPDVPGQADLIKGIYRCTECPQVYTYDNTKQHPAAALGRHMTEEHGGAKA